MFLKHLSSNLKHKQNQQTDNSALNLKSQYSQLEAVLDNPSK